MFSLNYLLCDNSFSELPASCRYHINDTIFVKKVIEHKICILIFYTMFI
jgi:hypothetical protein